jgi:hypothetical protein
MNFNTLVAKEMTVRKIVRLFKDLVSFWAANLLYRRVRHPLVMEAMEMKVEYVDRGPLSSQVIHRHRRNPQKSKAAQVIHCMDKSMRFAPVSHLRHRRRHFTTLRQNRRTNQSIH